MAQFRHASRKIYSVIRRRPFAAWRLFWTDSSLLPVQAESALKDFLGRNRGLFGGGAEGAALYSVQLRLVALASFQSELSYELEEFQDNARRLSERAFSHLQRSIVADAELAQRWQRAFQEDVACEKLGACHLLAHGIWAFKASSAGERTDLIMNDRVDLAEAQRSAEALVLTEWKRVRQEENPKVKAKQAYEEARLYTEGSLAGFQLDSHRFLVIVSLRIVALFRTPSRRKACVIAT